jgi:predicted RNA-binding protein with PUA-like domain
MPWLIKSEPDVFSIDDLARVGREPWSGVRNYQARNFMWKEMREGDLALFYHSNAKPPGVAGVARVVGEPYPDPTQFEPGSDYFDPKSTPEKPRWWLVDFQHVAIFKAMVTLETLKADAVLSEMMVCQRGTRLSITPVAENHFKRVCKLGGVAVP